MKNEIQKLDYCNKAIKLKNDLEGGFIALGEYLHNIKENSLWEASWGSWDEFTWELKMSQNMINKLVQIYRTFVLEYGMTQEQISTAGGWSVVADVLPMVTSKKEALHWLNKAQSLTRADLRKEMQEEKTGIIMSTCSHPETYTIEICKVCGDRKRV